MFLQSSLSLCLSVTATVTGVLLVPAATVALALAFGCIIVYIYRRSKKHIYVRLQQDEGQELQVFNTSSRL